MSQNSTIIYIDDDELHRSIFDLTFGSGKLGGRTVVIFEEAGPAIQKLKESDEIGLVVTDWNLAHGTSADLCKLALQREVPLLVFSGSNPDEIYTRLNRIDITILDKSCDLSELQRAVQEKLR